MTATNSGKISINDMGVRETIKSMIEILKSEKFKRTEGLLTGFIDLDKMLGGLRGGNLIVIASYPGMGVTSFALCILELLTVRKSIPVLYFSMDICKEKLIKRMMAGIARIDFWKIRNGKLKKSDFEKLNEAAVLISDKPLYIDDTPRLTINEIIDKARKVKKQNNIKCLVIDYFQMMRSKHSAHLDEKDVVEISRKLKALAAEMNIPIILLAQLSLDLLMKDEDRSLPLVEDLGDSILLDRFADVMMMVNRESYHSLSNIPQSDDQAAIYVTRNRNGPTGGVFLKFWREFSIFTAPAVQLIEET